MTITPQQQKAVRKWFYYIRNYILVVCIFFGCIKPDIFKVDYNQKVSRNPNAVLAAQQDQNQNYPGIRLDNLIVGEDGSTKVKYIVKDGDTVQSIAKQFGTTKQSILDANGITDSSALKVGQHIVISYDNGVIVTIKKTSSLTEFAKLYNLNIQDLVSMNYFDNADVALEEDQEIFVNLNQQEAEERGLIEKKPYESPFERFKVEDEEQKKLDAESQNNGDIVGESGDPQQNIISAEETAEQIAQANSKDVPEEKTEEQTSQENNSESEKEEQPVGCDTNMCLFDGKCVKRPDNAYCTKNDMTHAWKCKQGFIEQNKTCVKVKAQSGSEETKKKTEKKPTEKSENAEKKAKKKSSKAVSQGYFNPRSDGAPSDGRGPGQCTAFAHWYWWKYYGIKSMGFRGNAKAWPRNAARAGWRVNKIPAIGSLGVTTRGGGGYGHVFVIIGIDGGSVQIQEMNYAGRYIVTKRWMSASSINAFIHPTKD